VWYSDGTKADRVEARQGSKAESQGEPDSSTDQLLNQRPGEHRLGTLLQRQAEEVQGQKAFPQKPINLTNGGHYQEGSGAIASSSSSSSKRKRDEPEDEDDEQQEMEVDQPSR
jgi:hypothetical protein